MKLHSVVSPTETVIVSAYDKDGKAEACTLAFYMVSSHKPPCVTIAINATQKRKNAIGSLNPKKFGGLSYYVYEYRDNNTTAVINTQNYGKVKIYIQGTCATITVGSHKYNTGSF